MIGHHQGWHTTFFGKPKGYDIEGWYDRPEPTYARRGPVLTRGPNAGRRKLVRIDSGGRPRLLIAAYDQTKHEPILVPAGEGGGGGGLSPTVINVSKGGAITAGLVTSMRAPIAMEMKAANPVVIEVETAPGVGNAFGVVVSLNGSVVGTVTVSGTNKLVSAPVDLEVAAGDKITIAISITGSAGAAADLGITTLWHPVE
jgi:hypothetical protein